jgi:hypothetical protein
MHLEVDYHASHNTRYKCFITLKAEVLVQIKRIVSHIDSNGKKLVMIQQRVGQLYPKPKHLIGHK